MNKLKWLLFILPTLAHASAYIGAGGGGGGGGMAIGDPVVGASPEVVLYVDAAGNLSQDPGVFTYDETVDKLTLADILINGALTNSSLSTGVVHSDVAGLFSSSLIVDADVDAAAAITRSKLATSTAYRILANDAAGVISENAALTASRGVVSDANGQLSSSTATATQVDYLASATAAIADTTNTGLLSSTDWNTFNNKEPAVTKGDLTAPVEITVTGGTGAVIGSGTSLAWSSAAQHAVFAGPSGSAGTPAFRALVASDIPAIAESQVTASNNNRFVVTSAGTLAEAVAISAGLVVYTDTNGLPTGEAAFAYDASTDQLTVANTLLKTALKLEDPGAGTNTFTLQAGTLASDRAAILPTAAPTNGWFIQTNGSGQWSYAAVTAGAAYYNALAADTTLDSANGPEQFVTCSGSGTDITLFICDIGAKGYKVNIKRNDASNVCTIKTDPSNPDTIDGSSANVPINLNFQAYELVCNGSNAWFVY